MRISDWSSDVCSSDLAVAVFAKCKTYSTRILLPYIACKPFNFIHGKTVPFLPNVMTPYMAKDGTLLNRLFPRLLRRDQESCGRIDAKSRLMAYSSQSDMPALLCRSIGRRSEEQTSEHQSLMRN